jgi:hypothetical protein
MRIICAVFSCVYGFGFMLIEKRYEASMLAFILAVLIMIWDSVEKRDRRVK